MERKRESKEKGQKVSDGEKKIRNRGREMEARQRGKKVKLWWKKKRKERK